MKLIVGLGNPGRAYQDTRHNIGFLVVRKLASSFKVALKRGFGASALTAKSKIGKESVILALPLSFMNLSGAAVKALVRKYKIDLKDLLVICDDLDLGFGRLKIRAAGSSAGHHGLESIITALETSEFCRLKIGIGIRPKNIEGADFVLSAFSRSQKTQLEEILGEAVDCCQYWAAEGIEKTMNIFNRRE